MVNPVSSSQHVFNASLQLTSPLVSTTASQDQNQRVDIGRDIEIKASIRQSNQKHWLQKSRNVCNQLSPQLKHYVDLGKEKGASLWLSVFPLDDHGFSLHKGAFGDAICLCYGWKLPNTPTKCNCGSPYSTDHAMICPMGGFPTIGHNELHITASLLSEICHNVATEPRLQPLSGESMTYQTVITTDDAHLDIHARGFWSAIQDAYFDIRVFHPNAPSNNSGTIPTTYRKHGNIKKRAYGQHVRNIEHGVFTPLVLSTTGGMGHEATTFYKRLADMLTSKGQKSYSIIISWLRCKLSFASIRASIMCISGTRLSKNKPLNADSDITLATTEGGIPRD